MVAKISTIFLSSRVEDLTEDNHGQPCVTPVGLRRTSVVFSELLKTSVVFTKVFMEVVVR